MNKTQHRSNNAVLGAPEGWNQESLPCDALPVTRTLLGGAACVVSYWSPTPEEIAAMSAGNPIALYIIGHTMPPVMLCVEAP